MIYYELDNIMLNKNEKEKKPLICSHAIQTIILLWLFMTITRGSWEYGK